MTSNGLGGYNTAIEREFVWGARYPEPVAMVDHTNAGAVAAGTPEVLHYLNDVLGSVVALTNANGAPVERYEYDPYGTTYIEWRIPPTGWHFTDAQGQPYATSRYGNPFMWTGQRFDPTTGQYHFWARTYSPRLGRWLQRDPLGYADGVSLNVYGSSKPLDYVDPAGLWPDLPGEMDDPFRPGGEVGDEVKTEPTTAGDAGAVVAGASGAGRGRGERNWTRRPPVETGKERTTLQAILDEIKQVQNAMKTASGKARSRLVRRLKSLYQTVKNIKAKGVSIFDALIPEITCPYCGEHIWVGCPHPRQA